MIFVINNLKYDTDKMELISDECEYWYKGELLGTPMRYRGRDVRLWRSSKGNWLLTYKSDYTTYITCEHKDKCRCLKDMIEKETKKRND